MPAWNNWYHCMANTYGTWLPGDPRGFRTRDHRHHIEGDYKSPPPPGLYEKHHAHAKQLLKHPPVHLTAQARTAAAEAIRYALVDVHHVELLALAVSAMHLHLLARFPSTPKPRFSKQGLPTSALGDPPRHYLGIAKKESAKSLARAVLVPTGGLWAARGKIKPITDRAHQLHVFQYILDHYDESAAVWDFRHPHEIRIVP
ncbi:MAG: hypothetical protein ACYC26_14220 [Phycisphaerales bacterium]